MIVLSVGGWTYSQDGHFSFVTDASKRATFVSSAVQLIKDYGFDEMYMRPPASTSVIADLGHVTVI
jgi:GH18 family chitinase